MYEGLLAYLQGSEETLARVYTPGIIGVKTPITTSDVAFLAEEIYRGRSAITGLSTRIVLVRWEKPTHDTINRIGEGDGAQKCSNIRLGDLVCMTKEEANRHEKEVLKGSKKLEDLYDSHTLERVAAAREEAAKYEGYR
jgi:hypothetical protein